MALSSIISSCNTEKDSPDYRDEFVGEYFGIRTNSSWMLGEPGTSSQVEDTVLVVAVGDSLLRIDGTEIPIGPDGYFFEYRGGSASSYYSAEFSQGDSLTTELNGGGLGGGYHSTFQGKKY
ncbi:MAG: hypothetical protein H6603_08830 [Flavobacteriales bacterium]|nr:hypothetical protein [Flavobacteriales bacterium]MCB9205065.1 hypothetical protein [Flavobacteriales bacterium]